MRISELVSGQCLHLACLGFVLASTSLGSAGAAAAQSASVWQNGLFELGPGGSVFRGGQADISADASQPGPDWEDLFAADRSWRDEQPSPGGNGVPDYSEVHGGQWAVIMRDDVSLGRSLDTTVLRPDGRVDRGTVTADDDLGNAYVYSALDASDALFLYAAVERLGNGDSEVEIELNQPHIRLGHGPPWVITGGRAVGDLLIRISFAGGAIESTTVHAWQQATGALPAFEQVAALGGEGCNAADSLCATTNGATTSAGPWGSFDPQQGPANIAAGRFVEIGVNVTGLLGGAPGFVSIQVRTPTDITFGYFAEGN